MKVHLSLLREVKGRKEGRGGEHTITLLLPLLCFVGEFAPCEFEGWIWIWIWRVDLHAPFGFGVEDLEDGEGFIVLLHHLFLFLFVWGEGDCVGGGCALAWGGVVGCVCVGHFGGCESERGLVVR